MILRCALPKRRSSSVARLDLRQRQRWPPMKKLALRWPLPSIGGWDANPVGTVDRRDATIAGTVDDCSSLRGGVFFFISSFVCVSDG